ncbi:hypothetical protein PR048_010085 [Dryococelus australis]|uniref:Uncharacterized protein n=1 Tax=Dryococelus australis TaxID=614101 RepID=A0ABQ9I1R3_9NEOP|nr:hypothetical protein PR048_010085 [Dryococelus australis]
MRVQCVYHCPTSWWEELGGELTRIVTPLRRHAGCTELRHQGSSRVPSGITSHWVTDVLTSNCGSFKSGEVLIFGDTLHLLKRTRNHVLDQGFESSSSEKIQKYCVQKLQDLKQKKSCIWIIHNWKKKNFVGNGRFTCLVRVMDHRNEMQFQLGIRVTDNSLKNCFHYLKGKYVITYIPTDKSYKDVLENEFLFFI